MDWTAIAIVAGLAAAFFIFKRFGQVSKAAALKYLGQGAAVIDVRTPSEFQARHLPGAINIPLGEIGQDIVRHAPDKAQVLLLHCLSGGRSGLARGILQRMGYTRAFNLGSYGRAEQILRLHSAKS